MLPLYVRDQHMVLHELLIPTFLDQESSDGKIHGTAERAVQYRSAVKVT
jgi:hypothetical protein